MSSISPDEIVFIHDQIIKKTGGGLGVREPGLLLAIAAKPHANFGGEDLYPTVFLKAAALYEALCNYHIFIDGNKRCGIAVCEYFLHKNNYLLQASRQQKEEFTLFIATTNPNLEEVAAWLQKQSKEDK